MGLPFYKNCTVHRDIIEIVLLGRLYKCIETMMQLKRSPRALSCMYKKIHKSIYPINLR